MQNIEISKIIDGIEVVAITEYAHPSEFSLKLKDNYFKGCISTGHIMYMALGVNRFIENDNTFSAYGFETAYKFIEILHKAKQNSVTFEMQIIQAVQNAVQEITKTRSYYDKKLKNYQELKQILKEKFKQQIFKEGDYQELLDLVRNKIFDINQTIRDNEFRIIRDELNKIDGLLQKSDKCNLYNSAIIKHVKYMINKEFKTN